MGISLTSFTYADFSCTVKNGGSVLTNSNVSTLYPLDNNSTS